MIALLSAIGIESQALGGQKGNLCPATRRVHRSEMVLVEEGEPLAQPTHSRGVAAVKERSREPPFCQRLQHPVDRKKPRWDRYAVDVRLAYVETRSDFNSPAGSVLVPEFEAPLERRAGGGKGGLILGRHPRRGLTGFIHTSLRPQTSAIAHRKALLDTRLR